MLSKYSENKENAGSPEKNKAEMHEEIARLRKLLEIKERELKTTLESASLKNEILLVREKLKARGVEYEKNKKEIEIKKEKEIAPESKKESPEQGFEDLSMARKAAPTKLQIKKITRQMKDADIAHQLIVLVDLARFKGVYYAVKIAKKLGNAYLLDRLHDAIVNDLYEELVKDKKLQS
ncbi:MAG: hypothetical protein Q8N37_01755 [bacterium]|nr:hypothetical protein [bacterium]